eukprot:TRINITY_DN548_c0_g1_i1.p4 TRINITY_DN548_c0_g1~~TRINITY_DN548_c0_g1_i1.p4  ORF type:complete len:141 (+),score=21.51 TRINITY_DN548_c0_g1_i1:1032-1454(+)
MKKLPAETESLLVLICGQMDNFFLINSFHKGSNLVTIIPILLGKWGPGSYIPKQGFTLRDPLIHNQFTPAKTLVLAEVLALICVKELYFHITFQTGMPTLDINFFKLYTTPRLLTYATTCLLYTSPSPRDATLSRMPSSA